MSVLNRHVGEAEEGPAKVVALPQILLLLVPEVAVDSVADRLARRRPTFSRLDVVPHTWLVAMESVPILLRLPDVLLRALVSTGDAAVFTGELPGS
jgi:hypothetical protein